MAKNLPARPNLDHLRRQAKKLLAELQSGDSSAVETIRTHLPAARGMTPAQIRAAGFRLADAQSAIARKTGFDAWPQLARHVEQLRALEGTWEFVKLEVEGQSMPPAAMQSSRLLMDGDRFRMDSPEATYEGVFNIDVEAEPHQIDIEFVEGPEAVNWNYGIFRLNGDEIEICLNMHGKARPAEFRTSPGSGNACETLRRESSTRPPAVTGGNRAAAAETAPAPAATVDESAFAYAPSETLTRLAGEWSAEKIVLDGKELPRMMLKTGSRSATRNEIRIQFGGMLMIHALVRIDENTTPMQVDYYNIGGQNKGTLQHGIFEWRGQDACFCMAAPGQGRPGEFESPAGSGRTLSVWRRKD